jgi:outer membrane protein OmpA-like peptidoglycan-associated protein
MIRKLYLVIISNILIVNLIAQTDSHSNEILNLVLNPSFEEFQDKIPCNFYYNYKEFNYAITNWKTPNQGKPHIFNVLECEPDFFYSSVEDSLLPHSGNTMLSIKTYKGGQDYQEYIQGTLKEPLEKGKYYYIEFYISRNFNAKYASNNLGICLIDNPSFKNEKGPIELSPDFYLKDIIFTKKGEWIKISKTVKARSNSKYFIIGNFFDFDKTEHVIASEPRAEGNSALGTATYFIDDVLVIPTNEHFINKKTDSIIVDSNVQDTTCNDSENLIRNCLFDDYEVYMDDNNEEIYSPLYWHYNTNNSQHPIYFSTDRFLNKSIIKGNEHPDSKRILQGETLNYIGVPILPKSEPVYSKLKCKLEKGCSYELSVKIRLFGYSNCFSDLIVDFSGYHPSYYDSIAQSIQLSTPDSISPDYLRENWVNLSTIFQAKGNEEYLIIGSNHESEIRRIILSNINKYDGRNEYVRDYNMSYLIDSVVLKKVYCADSKNIFAKLDSLEIGDSFVLENIQFDFDKSSIQEKSFPYLDELFDYLEYNSDMRILIIGHTDNIGTESYNIDLSIKRAKAVVDYLINKGIEKSRLDYKGVGYSQPIKVCDSEEEKQLNRRVEIRIIQ